MPYMRWFLDNTDFDNASLVALPGSASGWPVESVQDQRRKMSWKSSGLTGCKINIDFGSEVYFSGIGIVNHNLTTEATITVKAGSTPGESSLLNETFYAVDSVVGFGEGGFGDYGFGGFISDAEAEKLSTDQRVAHVFSVGVSTRYATIEFDDPYNPDGYVEVGRIFLCEVVNSPRMPLEGMKIFPVDETNKHTRKTLGGEKRANRQDIYFRLEIDLAYIPPEQVWWDILVMLMAVGTFKDFITDISFLDDGTEEYQDFFIGCIYGRLVNNAGVTLTQMLYGHTPLVIEESL